MRPAARERLASAARPAMLTSPEPKASAVGLLADSSRRLLAERRSFRFMSRQLVQSVKRRPTTHRKRQRFGLRIIQPRPADILPQWPTSARTVLLFDRCPRQDSSALCEGDRRQIQCAAADGSVRLVPINNASPNVGNGAAMHPCGRRNKKMIKRLEPK